MGQRHPIFARVYERLSKVMEKGGVAEHRDALLDDVAGRVIEVGAGNGLNFSHYPDTVADVLAVEPEPRLRASAATAAEQAAVPITVVDGVADRLPAGDASFDVVVASLMLCSVPEQPAALSEMWRVLRPGGELRFFEHVRSRHPRLAKVQRATDVVWPFFAGGCHTARDTLAVIEGTGFTVERVERFRFPPSRVFFPTSPHMLGLARKPAERG